MLLTATARQLGHYGTRPFKSATYILSLVLFCLPSILPHAKAQEWVSLGQPGAVREAISVISSDAKTTLLQVKVDGFTKKPVTVNGSTSFTISATKASPLLVAGAPDLCKYTTSIVIPDKSGMKVEVLESSYQEFHNIAIAPSKGNLKRNIDPNSVPFTFGKQYEKNAFYPGELASLREPYVMRDLRGQAIVLYPFQYNPVTKVLRVYSDMKLKVSEDKTTSENMLERKGNSGKISKEFAPVYDNHFANLRQLNYTPVAEQGKMLIISHGPFMQAMQPFVNWKIRTGIPTEIVNVAQIGNTPTAIKNFVANFYNTNGLTFLLLVGDAAQVATPYKSGGSADPTYGHILGNDSYAEVIVGRFSAESLADVQTQVQRVLEYEQNPSAANNWLAKGIAIASQEGPGDDNEYDYQHARGIRSKLMGFTYTQVDELYEGDQGGADAPGWPNPGMVISALNEGRSIFYYTGHGWNEGMATSDFSNADVPQLSNVGKLPFIWSVACVNGEFEMYTCFAEKIMRAQQNNQPTGAVGAFMSSINQSWSPPMHAQDEMADLLVGTNSQTMRTFGGLSINGCMAMNDEYGAGGYEMTDTWHLFGDPSMPVRTATAQSLTASHILSGPIGINQLSVSCAVNGALVALSDGNQVLATGYANGGAAMLNFSAVTMPDTLFVTVTAFNRLPYQGQVLVVPTNAPYVMHSAHIINDISGNSNNLPDYGETISLDVTLHNFGTVNATGVTATLSSSHPAVTINSASQSWGTITGSAGSMLSSAFSYTLSGSVADQTILPFTITITDDQGNTWVSNFNHVARAPKPEVLSMSINDSQTGNNNGRIDAGETVQFTFSARNTGHSSLAAAMATLSSTNSMVTIGAPTTTIGNMAEGALVTTSYTLTFAPTLIAGTVLDFTLLIGGGAYTDQQTFTKVAGQVVEDFETANLLNNPWVTNGTSPWNVVTESPYAGAYCSKSGSIPDDGTSVLQITTNVQVADVVKFMYKVSTEAGYDYLTFYIDGQEQDKWSGTVPWTLGSFPIAAGNHTLTWKYEKDYMIASGSDCAWLDDITLPPVQLIVTGAAEPVLHGSSLNAYPNPALNNLAIRYTASAGTLVSLSVFNSLGREVAKPVDGKISPGTEEILFDATKLSAGIYHCVLAAGDQRLTTKIVIVK